MTQGIVPVEQSLVGAVLSRRFLLSHEIGRGGMGAVYAAKPLAGGAPVAIKILHSYFVADEAVLIRFMEEGRTCMRLVHPNILRVHECLAAEDGSPYLVMDLLEGIPLSAYTKDGGRVALNHAIPILRGMLAGLEAAHASGVVHRDLKPGNVFLARDGGVFSVKLLDFGIAKVMDAAGGMGTKTRTGALLGTPAYMSPEQVKSAKDVDGRSDLWSVGVLFYEMLSGRVAFAAPTEYARLAAVISAQPPPIDSIDPELIVVSAFLHRALEKDRDRRFQTAREMSDALAALASTTEIPDSKTRSGFTITADSHRTVSEAAPPEASPWSLVTDTSTPPLGVEATPRSPGDAGTPPREVLVAALQNQNLQSSTLASPNRSVSAPPPPPAPDVVVVVPDDEVAKARKRSAERPTVPPKPPRSRGGIAAPLVAMMVTVALAFGFTLGVLFGRAH
jgi:serine/threonine-protein kinase